MECKKCGFNNIEEAKFCAECGSRLDGKKVCPKCNQTVDESSKFCPYCGVDLRKTSINTPIVKNENRKNISVINIFEYIKVGVLSLGVLLTLIFFLMTGLQIISSSDPIQEANIFDMLAGLFKYSLDASQLKNIYVYVQESETILHILTLIVICLLLLLVPLFAGLFIYRLYARYYQKKDVSCSVYGLSTCLAYVTCSFLLLNLNFNNLEDAIYVDFNIVTKIGVIIIVFLVGIYILSSVLKKLSENKGKGVLNQVFSIVLIIINVVILFLSSNTGLSFIAGNGTNQVSYNVAFGLSPVSYVGILSSTKDSNKLPVDFYGLSNTAVFCSLIAFVIHLLFVISVAISIIGLIKNIKGKKLNIFNIFTFVSCAISLVTFILSLIINHNYSSAFEVINLSNSISMGTHFVITIFVLTLVSGVMLLIKQLVIKEKQDN